MFPVTYRTARYLNVPSNFGSPSTPYMRRSNIRYWGFQDKHAPCFRALHRSESQLSIKPMPSVKPSKSITVLPEKPDDPPISIIEVIRAIPWSIDNWRNRLTPENVLKLLRNLPSHVMTAFSMVVNSREYDLARTALIRSCQLCVRIGRTAYVWFGLFLESREYFYLRYYTLLTFEHTIAWLRYGLLVSFDALRNWASKK